MTISWMDKGPPATRFRLAGSAGWVRIVEDRTGACSHPSPRDPVNIPQDIENRPVATGIDQETESSGQRPFSGSPQVTGSARLNLSRWRHGFKSRWDYKGEPAGQPGCIRAQRRRADVIYMPFGSCRRGNEGSASLHLPRRSIRARDRIAVRTATPTASVPFTVPVERSERPGEIRALTDISGRPRRQRTRRGTSGPA